MLKSKGEYQNYILVSLFSLEYLKHHLNQPVINTKNY